MQTLFEAANHIAQEIERTRQHLINLEQALEGLKPLITVDAATATLTYSMPARAQPVEDLSVVNAEARAVKKTKAKAAVKTKTEKPKAVKAKAVEPKVAVPEPVVAAIKLPSTGAELWLKCLGRKKASVNQIVDAALKKLKLDDSARAAIANRAAAWANAAEKKGVLVAAGTRDGYKLYQLARVKEEIAAQSIDAAEPVVAAEVA
jgi:hypothetical protein